jgi:diguanylate cyclase (GGDEF)-like protein
VAVPVLVAAILVGHHPPRWGFILAGLACFFASVVYLAFFVAITKGRRGIAAQANVTFAVACLALSALGFIAVGSSIGLEAFTPAVLVGFTFVSIIGNRWMRIAIATYAIALVAVISWGQGLRGAEITAVVIVYASTIVIVTLLVARSTGAHDRPEGSHRAIDALNGAFAQPDGGEAETSTAIIRRVFERGLPLVTDVLPAHDVVVFARNGKAGRFTPLVTWNADQQAVLEMAELPALAQALRTDVPVLIDTHCAIPIGFCADGELVMVVSRADAGTDVDSTTQANEAAELLAASFLRVTSRANFVSGLYADNRTDPLTGLANRRSLFERIEMEMAHALRHETPLSVAMIDLDHFKHYNDDNGHVAGDTLLRAIAAVMVSNIRGQDMVARYGGEEFCLVMPDTDLVGGHHLLETLRTGGRDATSDFPVTISAGLTSWDGVEDTMSFIERADQALYRAKETGRNRVVSIQAFTEF